MKKKENPKESSRNESENLPKDRATNGKDTKKRNADVEVDVDVDESDHDELWYYCFGDPASVTPHRVAALQDVLAQEQQLQQQLKR